MSVYRGEEHAQVAEVRVERAASLAERLFPTIHARRTSRLAAGVVGTVLGCAFLVAGTPHRHVLDFRADGDSCRGELIDACATLWRPQAFYAVLALMLCSWAITRPAAALRARARLRSVFAQARAEGSLAPIVASELRRVHLREWAGTAWSLAAAILLAPIAVQGLFVPAFGIEAFDQWIGTLMACAWPAQLVMIAYSVWDARRWQRLEVRQLEAERSWRRSFGVGLLLAVGTGLAFTARMSNFFLFAPALGLWLASVAGLTGLVFWPLTHRLVKRWLLTERSELADVHVALDLVDGAVRADDLQA
jgi:hypothetical protein